jgi:hypothetical protein
MTDIVLRMTSAPTVAVPFRILTGFPILRRKNQRHLDDGLFKLYTLERMFVNLILRWKG